jgi:hypothetical protein
MPNSQDWTYVDTPPTPSSTPSSGWTYVDQPSLAPGQTGNGATITDPVTNQKFDVPQSPSTLQSLNNAIELGAEGSNLGGGGWARLAFHIDPTYFAGPGAAQRPGESLWDYHARLDQGFNQVLKSRMSELQQSEAAEAPNQGWGSWLGHKTLEAIGGVDPFILAGVPAESALGRIAGTAGIVGTDNALNQGINIASGRQDSFDPVQTAASAALGAGFHGIFGELLPAFAPAIKRTVSSLIGDEGTGPVGSRPPVQPGATPSGAPAGVPNISDADKADIEEMRKQGKTTQEIFDAYPHLGDVPGNRGVIDWYRQNPDVPMQWHQNAQAGATPSVTPTTTNTHVDSIPDSDSTGTFHNVSVRSPNTGEVTSAGRVYVDPQTGTPNTVTLSHPLTGEPHITDTATNDIIRNKVPQENLQTSPTSTTTANSKFTTNQINNVEQPQPMSQVDEKYAGNTNKNVLGLNPEANIILDEAARAVPANDVQGHAQTIEQARQMLADAPDHKDFLYNTKIDEADRPAYQVATNALKSAKVMQIVNEPDKEVSKQLFDELVQDTPRYQQIAGAPGRELNARAINPETGTTPQTKVDPKALSKFLDMNPDPEAIQKAAENPHLLSDAWRAGMLTNWQTHVGYAQGLGSLQLLDLAQNAVGSGIGQLDRFNGKGDPRIFGREIAARAWGQASGALNAITDAAKYLATPNPTAVENAASQQVADTLGIKYNNPGNLYPVSLNDALGQVVNSPRKVIGTIGHIANEAGKQGQAYAMAMRRAIISSPSGPNGSLLTPSDLWERYQSALDNPLPSEEAKSKEHGDMLSLEDKPSALTQGYINTVRALSEQANNPDNPIWQRFPSKVLSGVTQFVAPFASKADAVARTGIRNLLPMFPGLDRYNTALAKGDIADRQLLMAKTILAAGAGTLLTMKALQGHSTGDRPSDPIEAAQFDAEGKIPNSYLGSDGQWHSYATNAAIAGPMTAINNIVHDYKKNGDHQTYWQTTGKIMADIMGGMADKTWAPSLAAIFSHDNGNFLNREASAAANTIVPAGLRAYNQTYIDTAKRDVRDESPIQQGINSLKAGIPGESQNLPQRIDIFGNPLYYNKGIDTTSKVNTDPAVQEISRLSNGRGLLGEPSKTYTDEDTQQKIKFTPEQYRQYQQLSGQYIRDDLARTMQTPEYKNMSDDERRDLIKGRDGIISSQRANARDEVLNPSNGWSYVDDKSNNKGWSYVK